MIENRFKWLKTVETVENQLIQLTLLKIGWTLLKTAENGWKWMKWAENSKKQLKGVISGPITVVLARLIVQFGRILWGETSDGAFFFW